MVKKGAPSDSNVLAFLEVPESIRLNLAVPDFTVINNSHFTLVAVNLEELDYFALKIKVVKSFDFFLVNAEAFYWDRF